MALSYSCILISSRGIDKGNSKPPQKFFILFADIYKHTYKCMHKHTYGMIDPPHKKCLATLPIPTHLLCFLVPCIVVPWILWCPCLLCVKSLTLHILLLDIVPLMLQSTFNWKTFLCNILGHYARNTCILCIPASTNMDKTYWCIKIPLKINLKYW